MGKLFEIAFTVMGELATWQDQTRHRRSDDPITARWRELHRKLGAVVLGLGLMLGAGVMLWLLSPGSASHPVITGFLPALSLLTRAAFGLAMFLALMASWYLAQILWFDRWPHDFEQ